jgi:hypothetical protein
MVGYSQTNFHKNIQIPTYYFTLKLSITVLRKLKRIQETYCEFAIIFALSLPYDLTI